MENPATHITPIFEVKDERFDVEHIKDSTLLIEASKERFTFCVVRDSIKTCLWLEDYRFYSLLIENQWDNSLKGIYQEHPFLAANYWKNLVIVSDSPYFTFVPTELFQDRDAHKYLQLLSDDNLAEKANVYYQKHNQHDITNVSGIQRNIVSWFREMYPARYIKFCHQTSVMLENLQPAQETVLYVFFNDSSIVVQIFKEQVMQYCNRFEVKHISDLAYYLLMICKELKLNHKDMNVVLGGEITNFSEKYQYIAQYFDKISFIKLSDNLKYSQYFDDLIEHRYPNLFGAYRFV